jgi:hypothetical protein
MLENPPLLKDPVRTFAACTLLHTLPDLIGRCREKKLMDSDVKG